METHTSQPSFRPPPRSALTPTPIWTLVGSALTPIVAPPFVPEGPGIVSAMWGVFVFGEIRGTRNYVVLSLAILLALSGCVLIGMSK